MRFASICSGIESASVAWHPLGWRAQFFAEIEPFPSAVLAHHYPEIPNLGDITRFETWPDAEFDVLVGGTPCQSFSVAGLRKGMADPRGNLMLTYLAIAKRYRPTWLAWENVPGVLSIDGGRAFGAFLGGLAQLGYGFAYRVLDAQFFNLAQRRARVFVVASLRGWQCAAAVLFERASLSGDPAPSREARKKIAGTLTRSSLDGSSACGGDGREGFLIASVAPTLSSRTQGGGGLGTDFDLDGGLIAHALRGEGFDASEDGTGRGTPIVPIAFDCKAGGDTSFSISEETFGTLRGEGHGSGHTAVAEPYMLAIRGRADGHHLEFRNDGTANAILTPSGGRAGINVGAIATRYAVRRLTPLECERLQGFEDDYTLIPYRGKPAADAPRYKALGNSKAVPVVRWIGQRISMVDALVRAAA